MRKIVLFSVVFLSGAGWAQAPSTHKAGTNPNETICRDVFLEGSRFQRIRQCKTRAQWAEERREAHKRMDRIQKERAGR